MGRHGGGVRGGGGSSGGSRSFGGGGHHHHHHHSHSSGGGVYISSNSWYHPYHGFRRRPRSCCASCFFLGILIFLIIILASAPSTKSTNVNLTAFETVLINPSTTWHSSVEVTNSDPMYTNVYLFDDVPPYGSQVATKNETQALNVAPRAYEYWAYRLSQNAKVTVFFSVSSNVNFLIISGRYFSKWEDGDNVPTEKELFTSSLQNYTFTATEENDYYFVWDNTLTSTASGAVTFLIKQRTYDVSNPTQICSQRSYCSFQLEQGSSQCVVILAGVSDIPNDVFRSSYVIRARSSLYWSIFGSVFAGLFLLGALVGVLLYLHFRQSKTSYEPLLPSQSPVPPSPYGGTPYNPSPPAYAVSPPSNPYGY